MADRRPTYSLRLSPEERRYLDQAAERAGITTAEYIRRAAVAAATDDLLTLSAPPVG